MAEGKSLTEVGQEVMLREAEAIRDGASRLNEDFVRAVEILQNSKGKVVIIGVGKSGHIGAKIAATFRSTGTPAVFLHAAEAVHGDLGLFSPGDPVIAISKSGATEEILRLERAIKQSKSPVIGIVGNKDCPMASWMDVLLDASVKQEADPLGVAPTSSAILALSVGDALAGALVTARGFTRKDFLSLHPSGQLGKALHLTVESILHPVDRVAVVQPSSTVKDVLFAMTRQPLGAACVTDEKQNLLGIFTDGDLRRGLERNEDLLRGKIVDHMTRSPTCALPNMDLQTAAELMEARQSQISVLPVLDRPNGPLRGLIRLHDIYQSSVT
ncbi:MAG: KpsF/GutQ family sugar-phosphate isomerase [Verrucomicrobiota bacterium]